jgi:hypothetical protein
MKPGYSISALRRRSQKVGVSFGKSRWRKDSVDNLGGYQVINVAGNFVIAGSRFDADLHDVVTVIEDMEGCA